MRDKDTRQCPQTTTLEEKGEPKRIRTEVLLLTSLTPYRWAKPADTRTHKSDAGSVDLYLMRVPSEVNPSLISRTVSVDVKHHVYFSEVQTAEVHQRQSNDYTCSVAPFPVLSHFNSLTPVATYSSLQTPRFHLVGLPLQKCYLMFVVVCSMCRLMLVVVCSMRDCQVRLAGCSCEASAARPSWTPAQRDCLLGSSVFGTALVVAW